MSAAPLLTATGLSRTYGRHQALKGIDLALRGGEILAFLGLNGAGKTTALEIMAGARCADAGSVTVCGQDPVRQRAAARACVGYLPQSPPLYDDMRVDEYLAFSARIQGVPGNEVRSAVARARGLSDLDDVGQRLLRHLSAGYRQRVGIAQAIVHRPAVLILDEPTTGLDPAQIQAVHALVRELAADCAVLLSTHVLAEARALATRVAILHQGRIVHDAPLAQAASGFTLRTAAAADTDALRALDGVTAVSQTGSCEYHVETAAALAPRLAELAVNAGWGVLELVADHGALDTLFARVTAGPALDAA